MVGKSIGFVAIVGFAAMACAAHAETIDYLCSSDKGEHVIHVDTTSRSVRHTIINVGTAEFSDGISGKLADSGELSLIGPVLQIVQVSDGQIYFGLKGDGNTEDGTLIDRHSGSIVYVNGSKGHCESTTGR